MRTKLCVLALAGRRESLHGLREQRELDALVREHREIGEFPLLCGPRTETRLCVLAARGFCYGLLVVLVIWGMKRNYAGARANDLTWILGPTTHVVEVMTGTRFAWQPGEGYFSRDRMFLIEKSCAGINFMIAAFGMLMLALLHRVGSGTSVARVLAVSLLASYAAAVGVNAVRITIAMWLAAHSPALVAFSAADVHRVEGIVVYFGGLLLLYELARRLDRSDAGTVLGRTALPLAVYYAVTLAIPLANGAALSSAFAEHALVVVLMPLVVIIFAGAMVAIAHALRTAVRSIAAQRGPTERSDADDDEAACNFAGATVPGRRP